MKIDVRVEATGTEKRRFLGQADITPMIELVSDTLDTAMLAVVQARLAALTSDLAAREVAESEERHGH
ncbi:MAG: hypothetical protein OEU92_28965 [Alphaproteobacteria bacterium]|nr:hypothetical protein [Alphaproteobacteria bacterium]